MSPTISNACGTIGLIHAIANNKDKMHFESGSTLKNSSRKRARYLENYDAIRVTHETSAHEGQTEAPSVDEKVDLHFIALVHVDGHLYEVDGWKPFPINHGETKSLAAFLKGRLNREFLRAPGTGTASSQTRDPEGELPSFLSWQQHEGPSQLVLTAIGGAEATAYTEDQLPCAS
ncbi:hypothetical protein GH733_000121 [Mirounga leonina]|nr:hypothetical protein GH733_000121 [Mirounga leonina]